MQSAARCWHRDLTQLMTISVASSNTGQHARWSLLLSLPVRHVKQVRTKLDGFHPVDANRSVSAMQVPPAAAAQREGNAAADYPHAGIWHLRCIVNRASRQDD